MDKTLIVLQKIISNWGERLNLGKMYNTPFSIGFSDDDFELLTCIEHNINGTGSSSHGYDHDNGDETKGTSLVQPKKCKVCGSKLHFFKDYCHCGSDEFEFINDSRWGIDAKAHFLYEVPNYHFWIFEPEEYNTSCRNFSLKQYVIDSNNISYNEILKTQVEKGKSVNKNFIPYSSDFYASNPIEISRFKILIHETFGVFVNRETPQQLEYNQNVIKKMSKILDSTFINNKDTYLYEELIPYINIKDKKTTHGKFRGETKRRKK